MSNSSLRILFLDDSLERCRVAKRNLVGSTLDIVNDATSCLEAMRSVEYDIIMLDHDLEATHYHDNRPDDKDGSFVVRVMLEENLQKSATFLVHSLNTDRARAMVSDINRSGRNCLGHFPFAWQMVSIINNKLVINTEVKQDYSKE